MNKNALKKFNTLSKTLSKGFSLAELLVVVGIVGILSVIMLLSFSRNTEEERLKAASKITIDYLKTTLIHSRQISESCTVSIDHGTSELSIANPDTCDGRPSVNLIDAVEGLTSLKICGSQTNTSMQCTAITDGSDTDDQGTPLSETQVVFTPRGSASKGAILKLYSSKGKRARCIAVTTPIGLVREGRETSSGCDFAGG
tara:strand:- start:358 stop:957 length:600 start_codon:yes stop_codon:yes gene_type:complete